MTTLFSPIREFFKKGDVLLLFLCLTASGYGLALIYSATRYLDNNNRNVIVQAVAICIGVVIYIVLTFVDFQLFVEKCWKWLVAFDVGFILLLLTPWERNRGATGTGSPWTGSSPTSLGSPAQRDRQDPLYPASGLAGRPHPPAGAGHQLPPFSVAQLTGHTLLMVGLIAVVCGDIGMCVIYLFLFVTISWMAGVKARWFALGGTCFMGAILGAWFTILQSDRFAYIRNRFMVVLDHSLDPLGLASSRAVPCWPSARASSPARDTSTAPRLRHHTVPLSLPDRPTSSSPSAGRSLAWWAASCCSWSWPSSSCGVTGWAGTPAPPSPPMYPWGSPGCCWPRYSSMWACACILPVMGLTLPFFSYGGSSIITLYTAMGIVSSIRARTLPVGFGTRNQL